MGWWKAAIIKDKRRHGVEWVTSKANELKPAMSLNLSNGRIQLGRLYPIGLNDIRLKSFGYVRGYYFKYLIRYWMDTDIR